MYAPSKPNTFRRSSENTREGDRQATTEMQRLRALDADEQRDRYEALSYGIGGGMVAAGVVRRPTFEELYDAIEADDKDFYERYER